MGNGRGRSGAAGAAVQLCRVGCLSSDARGIGRRGIAADVRRCLGMDQQRLPGLPRLPARGRRAGGVQRKVHVQSVCPARRVVRDIQDAYPQDLSELLRAGCALAVHGHPVSEEYMTPGQQMNDSAGLLDRRVRPQPKQIDLLDFAPAPADVRAEVIEGLSRSRKTLPCKLLYDERGSQLFDRICEQPEYYPTRTELQITRDHAGEIAAAIGAGCVLVEYGS